MEKLKKRWNITSNTQLIIIFIVFAITGTTAARISGPVLTLIGLSKENTPLFLYWMLKIVLIFPIYQVLLVGYGWLFGQFRFFWAFEKKFLSRIGLGFLFHKQS